MKRKPINFILNNGGYHLAVRLDSKNMGKWYAKALSTQYFIIFIKNKKSFS